MSQSSLPLSPTQQAARNQAAGVGAPASFIPLASTGAPIQPQTAGPFPVLRGIAQAITLPELSPQTLAILGN